MAMLQKLSHNQVRYLLMPPLALALVHFVSYKKLPFETGYQFPLIPFLAALFICLVCCEINTYCYGKLSQKWSLISRPVATILKQLGISLMLTTVIFGVLVYSINYLVFGHVAGLTQFLSSLFVALLIISVETLVYIVRDFKRAQTSHTQAAYTPGWTIKSGPKTLRFAASDIAYVFSQSGLVYVVTLNGDKYLTQFSSLNELSAHNDTSGLFKLNRQFMISPCAISSVEKQINQKLKVTLTPATNAIPQEAMVSRYTGPEFKRWMKAQV